MVEMAEVSGPPSFHEKSHSPGGQAGLVHRQQFLERARKEVARALEANTQKSHSVSSAACPWVKQLEGQHRA